MLIASLAAAVALHQAPAPRLTVDGPTLLYGDRPVRLRGVCTGDAILAREGRGPDDYRRLVDDWNINVARIGMAPTTWRNVDRKLALDELDREVQGILDAGAFAMIDWHTIGWPDGYYQIPTWEGGVIDTYDSSMTLAMEFWKEMARRYGQDGRVIFQLWCEPVYNARDWETPWGSTWKELKPHFERMTNAIRALGAQNLILATGNQWAYDLVGIKDDLLPDANTAYMWHVYAGHGANRPENWLRALDDLDKVRPVLVTEWGFQEETTSHFKGGREDFGKPFLDLMESRGLHWVAWCWHPTWGPPMLQSDWVTPTDYGAFVKDALRINRPEDRPMRSP